MNLIRLRKIQRGVAILSLTLIASFTALAQERSRSEENYAVFVSKRNGAAEIYLLDLNTRQVSQLTNTGRGHLSPVFSPGSRTIAFAAREGASYELFSGTISSSFRTRRPTIFGLNRLTVNPMDEFSPSLTQDGGTMAFASGYGIEIMDTFGAGRRIAIPVDDNFNDVSPVISPKGDQIAFVSNRSGAYEIWLYTKATGELRQLTNGAAVLGGLNWSADARQIAFTTTATSSKLTGIALANAEGGSFRVLTDGNDCSPALSARGDKLIFTSMRDGDPELYLMNINSGRIDRLTSSLGADDSAIFLAEPVQPSRVAPQR